MIFLTFRSSLSGSVVNLEVVVLAVQGDTAVILVVIVAGDEAEAQAAKDYGKALASLKRNGNNVNAISMKEEVEGFFFFTWYQDLTDLDPAFLMQKIREEVGFDESKGLSATGILPQYEDSK